MKLRYRKVASFGVLFQIIALGLVLALVAACAGAEDATDEVEAEPEVEQMEATAEPMVSASESEFEGFEEVEVAEPDAAATDTRLAPDGQYGGILRTMTGDDPATLDYMKIRGIGTVQRTNPAGNMLWRLHPLEEGRVLNDLVENWEISEGGLEYSIRLKEGIKFHSGPLVADRPGAGTSLDCSDVKHTLEKFGNPDWSQSANYVYAIDSIECPSDLDVKLVLSTPDTGLIQKLSVGWSAIIPSELPYEAMETTVIGTGPFIFKEHITGEKAVLIRNEEYFRDGLPYLDEYHNFVIPDWDAMIGIFRSGQLDMTSPHQGVGPQQAAVIKESNPEVIINLRAKLWWNTFGGPLDKEPWNDLRVRQAFSLCLDRVGAGEVYTYSSNVPGGYQPHWTNWSLPSEEIANLMTLGISDQFGANMDARKAKARELLADYGDYSPDNPLEMQFMGDPVWSAFAYYEDTMRDCGFDFELDEVADFSVAEQRRIEGNFFLGEMYGVTGVVEPTLFYADPFITGGGTNMTGYSNSELDELYRKLVAESDPAARMEITHQMERILLTDMPSVMIYWYDEGMAWWPWLKNWCHCDAAYYSILNMEEVWIDMDEARGLNRPADVSSISQ